MPRLNEIRTLRWENIRHLLVAVEVLSRTTARYDRFTKRRLYQEVGIPLYWIVDPDDRAVEVWTPEATLPTVARDRVAWHPRSTGQYLIFCLFCLSSLLSILPPGTATIPPASRHCLTSPMDRTKLSP